MEYHKKQEHEESDVCGAEAADFEKMARRARTHNAECQAASAASDEDGKPYATYFIVTRATGIGVSFDLCCHRCGWRCNANSLGFSNL